MIVSTVDEKSGRPETCTLYCFTPSFGAHESRTWSGPESVLSPPGSPIERVKGEETDQGPGVVPLLCFGNSARTRQWKTPVPVSFENEVAGIRKLVKFRVVPSGWSIARSYDTAPLTELHVQTGRYSPAVSFVGLGAGAASVFWNVPVADQVRPMPFSSEPRTRQ